MTVVWKDEEGSRGVQLMLFQPELLQGKIFSPPAPQLWSRVLDKAAGWCPGTTGAHFQAHALSPML